MFGGLGGLRFKVYWGFKSNNRGLRTHNRLRTTNNTQEAATAIRTTRTSTTAFFSARTANHSNANYADCKRCYGILSSMCNKDDTPQA